MLYMHSTQQQQKAKEVNYFFWNFCMFLFVFCNGTFSLFEWFFMLECMIYKRIYISIDTNTLCNKTVFLRINL
ncbi:unnamed protein product [Brassica oleracea var. botrytis]